MGVTLTFSLVLVRPRDERLATWDVTCDLWLQNCQLQSHTAGSITCVSYVQQVTTLTRSYDALGPKPETVLGYFLLCSSQCVLPTSVCDLVFLLGLQSCLTKLTIRTFIQSESTTSLSLLCPPHNLSYFRYKQTNKKLRDLYFVATT